MSVNKVILVGRLGTTPTINYSAKGTAFSSFRIATSERRKDSDGVSNEYTEWHSIVTFGRLAEICVQHLTKGRQVLVDGSLKTSKWDDEDESMKFRTEIIANRIDFLGGERKKEDDSIEQQAA